MSRLLYAVLAALPVVAQPAVADLIVAEYLARNETGLQDEDGRHSDWIEIANTGAEPVSLDGWTLTDNENRLGKWAFPAATLAPGERRIVFASGKDRDDPSGEWHANFRLAAPGEFVGLVMPDGTVAQAIPPAPQFDDVSYGMDETSGHIGYLADITPGQPNGSLVYAGPVISDVQHAPENYTSGEDITVTARVTARSADVDEVLLHSVIGFGAESGTAMRDDGTGADLEPGDGIFTGVIAGRSLFGPRIHPGEMVRWRISATDTDGAASRLPAFLDDEGVEQSPEYFGTVAAMPDVDTDLPVFSWFTKDEGGSRTRSGARAAVFYEGRFYDNNFVRQRGGATNGQSQKFNFSNAFPVYVNEKLPAVGELNLNAQGSDPTFLRQSLAFESFSWVGNATCESFLVVMRLNGDEDRTGVLIEQVDEDFLERHGYDSEGDLYKMVQRANLDPVFADTVTGIEKKTGDVSDFSSIQTLVDGLASTGDDLKAYLFDSIDLPQVLNYLAVRSVNQDADDVRKNFYVYQDTFGDREWSIFPWDKDWVYGVTGDGGQHLKHPFFGDEAHRKDNANQWNKLYDALFNEPATRQMYLRRLRTVMDAILQPEDTPENERIFENRVDELYAQAEGDVPSTGPGTVKRYFPERRRDLYETYADLIPGAQADQPMISFGDVVFQPESGDQDEEYIQLLNPNNTAVDISGWSLEEAVDFTFPEGTVIPSSSLFAPGLNRLYVSPNVTTFRGRAESPRGGEGLFVQGPYQGHLSNRGERIVLRDRDGNLIAETSYEGDPTEVERFLLLSEIMYHPSDPSGEAEFLELTNASEDIVLDLSGLHFTAGIDFDFPPDTSLAPGEFLLLVKNRQAFESVYGSGLPILGMFANDTRLDNSGERIKLEDTESRTVFDLRYDDMEPWPLEAAGQGASLALLELNEDVDMESAASWAASREVNGSPGRAPGEGGGDDFTDADNDGLVRLLEEAFGTSDSDPTSGPNAMQLAIVDEQLILEVSLAEASGIEIVLEASPDLEHWTDAEADFERSLNDGHARWTKTIDTETNVEGLRIRAFRE